MKKSVFIIVGCLVLLLILGVVFFSSLKNPDNNINPSNDNGSSDNPVVTDSSLIRYNKISSGHNGMIINVWLEDKQILDKMRDNNMKYLFVDVGDTAKNGKLKTSEEDIEHFLDKIRSYESANNFDFVLLPYSEIMLTDYDLTSSGFEDNFVNDYNRLIEMGFDGIHVDIEAIPSEQREDYLRLLERLGREVPKNKFVSVYPGTISVDGKTNSVWVWSLNYYQQVADRADIVSVSGYDSGSESAQEYSAYLNEQINAILSREWNTNLFFTVPTHKSYPETLDNSLGAYSDALNSANDNPFTGISVFAEWTTDDNEWKKISNFIE